MRLAQRLGKALGLVISPWSKSAIVFILSSAVMLSIVRIALRPRLGSLFDDVAVEAIASAQRALSPVSPRAAPPWDGQPLVTAELATWVVI